MTAFSIAFYFAVWYMIVVLSVTCQRVSCEFLFDIFSLCCRFKCSKRNKCFLKGLHRHCIGSPYELHKWKYSDTYWTFFLSKLIAAVELLEKEYGYLIIRIFCCVYYCICSLKNKYHWTDPVNNLTIGPDMSFIMFKLIRNKTVELWDHLVFE